MTLPPLTVRLREALTHAGPKPSEVERQAGLTQGYLSRPLAGKAASVRDDAKLRAVARVCGVSYAWLAAGAGEMLDAGPSAALELAQIPPRVVRGELSPLVRAAFLAYRHGAWEPEDVAAVIELVSLNHQLVPPMDEASAVRVMTAWLHAARRLRLAGQPVTFQGIAWEVSSGGASEATDEATAARSAALNAEAREELRGLGAEPPAAPVKPTKPRR